MTSKQILAIAGTVALAVAVVGGSWLALRGDDPAAASGPTTPTASAVVTAFPDLPAPTGDPDLPGLASAAAAPGEVAEVPGPFDDRFDFEHLALTGRVVTGEVLVTSDVSELLDLQVQAGFFDGRGRLLGSARSTYHLDESHDHGEAGHDVHRDFTVTAPAAIAGRVVSAAVGVTVLVNE
jgi:hypothetical protein